MIRYRYQCAAVRGHNGEGHRLAGLTVRCDVETSPRIRCGRQFHTDAFTPDAARAQAAERRGWFYQVGQDRCDRHTDSAG